jgi:prepilin-type N-terminal cleavage/methylation domain-containing protein
MQSGFTLVEIAIVLVIIGLLLGGILKGQEMITQARIKNVVNDFNGITAAYFSYMDRYKAIPGDDPNATTRWTSAGALVGNANGRIEGLYGVAPVATLTQALVTAGAESSNFWWHMRLSGFVAGATTGVAAWSQPTNAVGGIVGVQTDAFTTLTGVVMCSANVPDKVASAVDTQVDDQRSNTGQMFARTMGAGETAATNVTSLTADTNYVETGSTQYVICKKI